MKNLHILDRTVKRICKTIVKILKQNKQEICICSAILLKDGRIVRGERHCDCYTTMQRKRITDREEAKQGFITSRNRFVDRKEGQILQLKANIKSADKEGYRGEELFSEDLY